MVLRHAQERFPATPPTRRPHTDHSPAGPTQSRGESWWLKSSTATAPRPRQTVEAPAQALISFTADSARLPVAARNPFPMPGLGPTSKGGIFHSSMPTGSVQMNKIATGDGIRWTRATTTNENTRLIRTAATTVSCADFFSDAATILASSHLQLPGHELYGVRRHNT